MYDVIIVGGGPAGLQAALTLGRMHKQVLLFDAGTYRNSGVSHMHNFITHDGTPPEKFREQARADLAAYPTVEVRDRAVQRIEKEGDSFVVRAGDARIESRRIILATGVRDELPGLPGLEGLWGDLAFACPFCHGHELSDRPIGLLGGQRALHVVGMLTPIGSSVTVFADGAEFSDEQHAMLERLGAVLRPEPVRRVARADGRVRVELDGADALVDGLFVGTGQFVQSAPFAEQLGLDLQETGCIAVDDFAHTSVPGVFAAGDLAHRDGQPMPMASVLAAAAAGQVAGATCVAESLAG